MGIYYPKFGNNGELVSYHRCNNKCHTIHFSYGSKTIHYFTKEEDDGIEQSIDDYIESQVDERVFMEAK